MKRRFLLLPFLLLCTIPAHAQCSNTSYSNGWTCVQQAGNFNAGSGNSVTATFGANVTAGNPVTVLVLLCNNAACSTVFGHVLTVTGTARSACTQDPAGAPYSSTNRERSAFVCTGAAGTTIIVTSDGSGGNTPFYLTAVVAEWTGGTTASPFDGNGQIAGGTGTTASVTMTVNSTANLFICAADNASSATFTPGSGFLQVGQNNASTFHEAKTGVSGSQSGTATWTGSAAWSIWCSSVKSSSSHSKQIGAFLVGP